MAKTLKKCQCGGKAETRRRCNEVQNFWDYSVICTKCGTQTKWFGTKAEAIVAWDKKGEFIDAFRRVIDMCDPQANSLISKDNPPVVKILADWGRKACDELANHRPIEDRLLEAIIKAGELLHNNKNNSNFGVFAWPNFPRKETV